MDPCSCAEISNFDLFQNRLDKFWIKQDNKICHFGFYPDALSLGGIASIGGTDDGGLGAVPPAGSRGRAPGRFFFDFLYRTLQGARCAHSDWSQRGQAHTYSPPRGFTSGKSHRMQKQKQSYAYGCWPQCSHTASIAYKNSRLTLSLVYRKQCFRTFLFTPPDIVVGGLRVYRD